MEPADSLLTRAYIGLGANLGEARTTLEAAFQDLQRLPQSRWAGRSRLYRSAPVNAHGPDYVNAVAAVDTGLEALVLLEALLAIEQKHGRQRPYPNAPRTLDLDLLLFGDLMQSCDQRLILPHPRGHLRAFVLKPLAEMAPDLHWPGIGPIGPLLSALSDQDVQQLDSQLDRQVRTCE